MSEKTLAKNQPKPKLRKDMTMLQYNATLIITQELHKFKSNNKPFVVI